jgi:flagellar biosynthesis/type III secretory pathway chaperone
LKKNSLFKNLPSLDQIIATYKKETNINPNDEDMLPGASNTGGEQTSTSIAGPTAVANNIIGELINLIYIRNILKFK